MQKIWQSSSINKKTDLELETAIRQKSHPMLKKIKRQLMIELILWVIALICFYSMFDAENRPWFINGLLVLGFLQAIGYNLSGYLAARNLVGADNIIESLNIYTEKLKTFKWTSIFSRTILMVSFIFFFSYGLEMNAKRLISISAIALIFLVQLYLIHGQWQKRIDKLVGYQESLFGS